MSCPIPVVGSRVAHIVVGRFHEELQQQAWLRVLQGRSPPSVQWRRAGAKQPKRLVGYVSKPAVRVNPTQAASEASSKVARIERCMAVLDPEDTTELKSLQGGPRPRAHGSSAPNEASGRLSSVLHMGSPTIGEGSRRSGGCSRDGGQVRG